MGTSGVTIREIGTITELKRGIVKLTGLPGCVLGQLLEFSPRTRGFVVGFTEDAVLALVLGQESALAVGQCVEVVHQPLRVGVGQTLLGRVISPLGEPLDGDAAPRTEAWQPMFHDAPGITARAPVERQLVTGVRTIDVMVPVGLGQRQLIIGDRMTGKTALALDTLLSQREQGVLCVYCHIGQAHQKLQYVIQFLRERQALDHTIVVAATASQSASEQFLAPYAACAIGEHLAQQGRDVLVVFDDLSKHAWAYRQLSLLLERPPGREAYPGDMFYIHSQLMERAGQFNAEQGGGSMTFFPICETQQGDVTGYICSNLISMTDGQLYLSSELFYEGIKPAIDVGLSVTRIGNKVQPPPLRAVSGSLRLELIQYQELQRLMRFSSQVSDDVAARQRRGMLLRRLMIQPAHRPMPLDDQTMLFYAFKSGWLDRLTEEGLALCLAGLAHRLPAFAQEALREPQPMTPTRHAQLEAGLEVVLRPYCRTKEGSHAVPAAPAR